MLKKFYIIFLVLQEIIAIKDAIPHLCCSHYPEKRKIGAKNPAGRKCSAVIIMSVFYPLETLGNGAKMDGSWIIPDLRMVFTPFCGVKNGRGF